MRDGHLSPQAAHRLVGHVDTVVTPMSRRGYPPAGAAFVPLAPARGDPPNQGSAGRKDPERIIVEHAGGLTVAQGDRIIALLERMDARLSAIAPRAKYADLVAAIAGASRVNERAEDDMRRLIQELQRMVSN